MHKIIQEFSAIIETICRENQVQKLYFFGSVVDENRFTEQSDIDIYVSFDESLSVEDYTEAYFSLWFSLEDVIGRTIDLTTEKSLQNPFFIEELNNSKVLFYESSNQMDGQSN